jgi:hypothetical protein
MAAGSKTAGFLRGVKVKFRGFRIFSLLGALIVVTGLAGQPAVAEPVHLSSPSGVLSARMAKSTLEGIIRVLAADTVEGQSPDHVFRGRSQDHYRQVLVVGDTAYFLAGKQARPNRRVRISGSVTGVTLKVDNVKDLGAAPAAITSTGTTNVLVMLAHWNTPDSVTPASARTQMFGDTNGWYRDASYTELGQTGDVTPWMRIAGPTNGECYNDHLNVMTQAKNAATALGYNLANYSNYVVYFPNNSWQPGSDCDDYAGWAYVGAQNTWLNGYMDRRATVHEQGHNYGLWHAHSYLCTEGLSGSCSWSDYGDDFDAMGASGVVGHFSAPHKKQLGWMSGRTVDLTTGGSANLTPLASDPTAINAVVVNVSTSRQYWLEYRQAIDFDSAQPSDSTNGVQIRVLDQSISGDTGANLLDVRPVDGPSVSTATLRTGESWISPEGFRFTTNSVGSTGAAVTVVPGVTVACPDAAFEPDDTAGSAHGVAVPSTQPRAFCTAGDQDWVSFPAVAGTSYRVETLNLAAGTDTVLDLYKRTATGDQFIATNDDSNSSHASTIDFVADASATYLVMAHDYSGAGDAGYTYDLKLSQVDSTAPTLSARTPGVNAAGVSAGTNVTATFSEPVSGVGGTTFVLRNAAGGAAAAAVTYNATTRVATLDPSADLGADSRYTATLTGGTSAIRDTAGNPLTTTSWSFTTGG